MKAYFFLLLILPGWLWAQPAASTPGSPEPEAQIALPDLIESLALTNQIHGPYVGFSGRRTDQYRRFEKLTLQADCKDLLALCNHENAVVRGYAFWGLARKQYPRLDSLLLAHAHDESPVVEIQGGVMNQIPLIEFMLWVVNPDLMDSESRKLDPSILNKLAELRFSGE